MRHHLGTSIVCGLLLALTCRQSIGKEFHWLGDAGSDVTNPANWLEQPDPDLGLLPGAADQVFLRWGDRDPVTLDYGAANATYEHILFNHAQNGGTTVNGTGTITVTRTSGPTGLNLKSIETQGGHRLSTVNVNVNLAGMVEARNGHDITFAGATKLTTVHAYIDDDQITTSDVNFEGPLTHLGYGEAKFMTGTGTVRFNNEVILDHQTINEGFGIRNGLTAILGPNFSAVRSLSGGGGGLGLDTVDMYNNSGFRLEADFLIGNDTDLFSRFGGGQNNTNKLDLNGFSDHVEFLGTHPDATFVIDFGATPGPNTFEWETTHHHVGFYDFVNFEIGVDTLRLGGLGSFWWTALDTETDGGGSPDTEVDKSHMTINGIPYGAFDPQRTTPYWTLRDPEVSRDVEILNFVETDADFDGDQDVDGADFLTWQRGFGRIGQTNNDNGDANGDGTVNGSDLALWANDFGSAGAAAAVPEPGAVLLAGLALASLGRTVRRDAKVRRSPARSSSQSTTV